MSNYYILARTEAQLNDLVNGDNSRTWGGWNLFKQIIVEDYPNALAPNKDHNKIERINKLMAEHGPHLINAAVIFITDGLLLEMLETMLPQLKNTGQIRVLVESVPDPNRIAAFDTQVLKFNSKAIHPQRILQTSVLLHGYLLAMKGTASSS